MVGNVPPVPIRQSPTLISIAESFLGEYVRFTGLAYHTAGDPSSGEVEGAIEVLFDRPIHPGALFSVNRLTVEPEVCYWRDEQTVWVWVDMDTKNNWVRKQITDHNNPSLLTR